MKTLVIISAEAEWRAVCAHYPDARQTTSPFGAYFEAVAGDAPVTFFQGGWGKISAAASVQYGINHLQPELIVNLGTCGGFAGFARKGDLFLAEKTVVYDIIEKMGDPSEAIAAYRTDLDISWAKPLPPTVKKAILLSADRDVASEDLKALLNAHEGMAADWESGAIAWVATRNNTPVVILRGVSDMISEHEAEAFQNLAVFVEGTTQVMGALLGQLPWIVRQYQQPNDPCRDF